MASKAEPFHQYCPRCDRLFSGSSNNKKLVVQALDAHIRRAHPDYLHMMEE